MIQGLIAAYYFELRAGLCGSLEARHAESSAAGPRARERVDQETVGALGALLGLWRVSVSTVSVT